MYGKMIGDGIEVMTIFNFISLAGGLSLFLYGMRVMGDGLKSGASGAFKKAMEKVTNNPFVGFLLGFFVTAVIQSSKATIVLTSGLVAAGILTLHQSLGVILGANVGTTMTAQIIRLLDINAGAASWLNFFKPSTLAPMAAVIGILLIMLFKFKNSDTYGSIAMGFAILFTGLLNMTAAVEPLSSSPEFTNILVEFSHIPILGFLVGAGATFIIQSSSATVGILQAMTSTGTLTFSSVYPIIIGVNIGDCVTTAIACALGSKADAKRTGVVHVVFNIFALVLIVAAVMIVRHMGLLDAIWDNPITSGGIANTHTLFRLLAAITLLPFCGKFETISRMIIKDDAEEVDDAQHELTLLDEKLFTSPALALSSVNEAISKMARLSIESAHRAMKTIYDYSKEEIEAIEAQEKVIDALADNVDNYLVKFSPHVMTERDNSLFNFYIQSFSEFERIGDYAVNLTENADEIEKRKTEFSDGCKYELDLMMSAIEEILDYTYRAFAEKDPMLARYIEPIEEVVDDLVATARKNHIKRLRGGKCGIYSGVVFLDILVNIERIADQCSNLGCYVLGLYDLSVAKSHHDYVSWLHHGNDEFFNEEYKKIHEKYYSKLEQVNTID